MRTLLTKGEYKCQQCQNEHSEEHEVLERKIIHEHHLHPLKNEASTTLQHGCLLYFSM